MKNYKNFFNKVRYIFYIYLFFFIASCVSKTLQPITSGLDLNFQKEPLPQGREIFQEEVEQNSNKVLLESNVEKKLSLQEENIRQLNQRLQEIETILKQKDKEILTLKKQQEQQTLLETKKESVAQFDSSLITQAIEKDFEQSFRINNDPLNFKIGDGKKDQVSESFVNQEDSIYQQIATLKKSQELSENIISKQVLAIPLAQIKPDFLLRPPNKPTKLTTLKGASEFYKKAYDSFIKENYPQAIKEFHEYIENYSLDSAVDNSFFWIGVAYWHQNKLEIAQKYFAYILQNFEFIPTSQGGKSADAMIMLGRISMESDSEDSKKYYQKVLELYSGSDIAKVAQKLLNEIP